MPRIDLVCQQPFCVISSRLGVLERSPLPFSSVDPIMDLPKGVNLHSRGFGSLSESCCGITMNIGLILLPTHSP